MQQYTRDEVAKHNKATDCWLIVDSRVYDVTTFLDSHPGGANSLLSVAGKDATDNFNAAQHKDTVLRQRAVQYEIGSIKGEKSVDAPPFPEEEDKWTSEGEGEDQESDSPRRRFMTQDLDRDRMSIISVHSMMPDSSPPAPEDSDEMSFENLRTMMPYGIPDAALHAEVRRLQQAGVTVFGGLGVYTLEELEKIVKPATARTLRHYLKGQVRPSVSSPTRPNLHLDLSVGFLKQLLGGPHDFALEDDVSKMRNQGILSVGGLAQFTTDDIEKLGVRASTARALKPYLKRESSTHFGLSQEFTRPLTFVLLRSLFPLGVPEAAMQDELNKLNQAGINTLGHVTQRTAEELGAIVKPGTVRALSKYLKPELQINTDTRKLKPAGSDPSEQPVDNAFLRVLLPPSVPDVALSNEVAALHQAGVMKVADLNMKTGDELDKIVKLVTSRALKHLTKDYSKPLTPSSRSSLLGSRTVVSASPAQEMTVAFLRGVFPEVTDSVLEEEVDKLRSASIVSVGDLERFQVADLEKIVSGPTARALEALRKQPEQPGKELNVAFLGTLMPGVPEVALQQEVAKLHQQQVTGVAQLEQYTIEDLEKFGVKAAVAKALKVYLKGGTAGMLTGMVSPTLSARPAPVAGGTTDNWIATSEISMAFLRSCMAGVPDPPLQEELVKLRNNKIVTVGQLSLYTLEEMEKFVRSSTARAMSRFLKNNVFSSIVPRGILSPNLGGQAGGVVPSSFALDSFPPFTEINLAFLRRVLPAGIPDQILQDEVQKLNSRGLTAVVNLGGITLPELEGIVKVGTARALARFLKDANVGPPKGMLSPQMKAAVPGAPLPAMFLASVFPTTEITTTFLRPLLPESQSAALQDEVLKLRSRNITTVGMLAHYSLQEMERIVLPMTARALSTFLKQVPLRVGAVSPTLGTRTGYEAPVPQFNLEQKAPAWTEISANFLRTVMPQNIPDSALQEEAAKLRQAGIVTVGHLSNYTVEDLERVVRAPTARSLPRYLKNGVGNSLLSPQQQAQQPQQLIPSFQLDRIRAAEAAAIDPQSEISLTVLRNVLPGVPESQLNEELIKLRNRQIRTLGNLSFFTFEDLQSIVRPGTSRALMRFLKNGNSSSSLNALASPSTSLQQPSAYIPSMSLQSNYGNNEQEINSAYLRTLLPFGTSEKELQEDVNTLRGLGVLTVNQLTQIHTDDIERRCRPILFQAIYPQLRKIRQNAQTTASPRVASTVVLAPPPATLANPDQELSLNFLRTLLPPGVPDAALKDELTKLKDNFILTVGNLSDYSPADLEKILLKLGTIRALKMYTKGTNGGTDEKAPGGNLSEFEDNEGKLTTQFLAAVMPKGVPEAALHVELAKLNNNLICTLYHLSFLTMEDMEKIVRLTTAKSLKEYLKGGSIQIPAPVVPVVIPEPLPDLPDGPPWTDKHAINLNFFRTVMPPGLPDQPLNDEIDKLKKNKIFTVGDLGKYTTEEITKLAGMSGWFLKDYAKEGPKCVYEPPPVYVPDEEITLSFMLSVMPPGIPEALIQEEVSKLTAAKIITIPDLGLKTPEELGKIVGMSGWFLKDYLKGGSKMVKPNPKPVPEEVKFSDGPEQELSGPFLKSLLPLGVPEDAPEAESKKLRDAGVLTLGHLSQYTPKDVEGKICALTVSVLSKHMRPPQVPVISPVMLTTQGLSPPAGNRNPDDEITVGFLRSVMPAGVPTTALQEEVGKLHARGLWTVGNLAQLSLSEMEQIVRATTARSLLNYLTGRRASVASHSSGSSPRSSISMTRSSASYSISVSSGGSEEVTVAFLRTVMPGGVPEAALQEEVGKMRAKGIYTVRDLSSKTLAEMEMIVRVTTARALKAYLSSAAHSTQQPRTTAPGGPIDWTKEEISVAFLHAMMPGVPDGPLQEEFNNLHKKGIARVNQLQQFTEYELGQVVRSGTVRALKNYLRGGTLSISSTPSPAASPSTTPHAIPPPPAVEITPSTEISVAIFRSLMPGVPEAPLLEEIAKLRSHNIITFAHLAQHTPEEFGSYVKPGIARALARFLRPIPSSSLPPPPPSKSSISSSKSSISSRSSDSSVTPPPPPPDESPLPGSTEVNLAFLRQAMPGVPEAPLLDELSKLRAKGVLTVSNLNQHTSADLEQFGLRAATVRALRTFLKPL